MIVRGMTRGEQLTRLRKLKLPSTIVINQNDSVSSLLAKAVLRDIDDRDSGNGCWASAATIAESINSSDRSVGKALIALSNNEYLTVEKREGRTSVYRVNWELVRFKTNGLNDIDTTEATSEVADKTKSITTEATSEVPPKPLPIPPKPLPTTTEATSDDTQSIRNSIANGNENVSSSLENANGYEEKKDQTDDIGFKLTEEPPREEKSTSKEKAMKKKKPPLPDPTIEEVRQFCAVRKNKVDPEHFHAHYTANGWKQSNGNKIVNWKAAIVTWEKGGNRFGKSEDVKKSEGQAFIDGLKKAGEAGREATRKAKSGGTS